MAKLITKFKFIRSGNTAGNYLKYIATREGVEKIDDSKKNIPATKKQTELIDKIIADFPDAKDMHEYEDYISEATIGSASEFITRALEDNANEMMNGKTYADYIATRPRAQRFGSHGLFTDDGVEIQLSNVSEELNKHQGNVWTVIMSLRREDAARLGFDDGYRWRDMLRTQTEALSKNLKIPMENLRWFAAFHNEGNHPHVHLIAYSTVENEGYLSKQGINNLRSSFAKDIFAQDLLCVYEKQTEHRNTLKSESRKLIEKIIKQINTGVYDNPAVEKLLLELADRLSKTSGRKQYGYLKAYVKDIIDSIIDEITKDKRISGLYDLWYQNREEIIRTYTQDLPARIPLSQNKEFKSIKNAIIQEALNINAGNITEDFSDDVCIPEPNIYNEKAEADETPPLAEYDRLKKQALSGNRLSQYELAKLLLERNGDKYNPSEAVEWLIKSAKQNYTVAQYMLGRMFLNGENVSKNVDYALRWLEEAAEQNNPYAQYLLGKTLLFGTDVGQDIERAEKLLSLSAKQRNPYAEYLLGKAYIDGTILLQDIPGGLKLLTKSADSNFSPAEYVLGKLLYRGEITEKNIGAALKYLKSSAESGNTYAAYLAGKIFLWDDTYRNTDMAIRFFKIAAESNNSYAEYQLGKIYLYGKENRQDFDEAVRWLTASAEHGNQYAYQILHSMRNNNNWSAAIGAMRLLHHVSRTIQNRIDDNPKKGLKLIDRKLKRQIDEKKQAHGLKQG